MQFSDTLYLIQLKYCSLFFICKEIPFWSDSKNDWDMESIYLADATGIDSKLLYRFQKLPEPGEILELKTNKIINIKDLENDIRNSSS